MTITRIKPQGKNLRVEFDEAEPLKLAPDVAARFILFTGQVLRDDEYSSLRRAVALYDGLVAAHRFLGYRARSSREVREKLRSRGCDAELIDEICATLLRGGFLDDADFSLRFVHDALLKKPVGRIRVRMELRRKGLDDATIDDALETVYDSQTEIAQARRLIARRRSSNTASPAPERAAMAQYLWSRGFTREAIDAALAGDAARPEDAANEET